MNGSKKKIVKRGEEYGASHLWTHRCCCVDEGILVIMTAINDGPG